ncbi:InlB B-repeat-containing protein [Phytomonospora sp. NPDC050363]|uniref:InlB B-repeat-containing protein n=1 Tax=Phytomonospora sp. NPDC050363 TaxID=3155642 RepID=UPI0033F35600
MMSGLAVRRFLVGAALACAALPAVPAPAYAVTVSDYPGLQAAFSDPAGAGGVATLTVDMAQGGSPGLILAAGGTLELDLNGHTLDTARIALAAGSTLTITDAPGGATGTLTADPPSGGGAGIQTSGATLVIEGDAIVVASSGSNAAAGIGGSTSGSSGGDITIRGNATVTATGGQFSAAIGGADNGTGGTITIGGNATVTATAEDGAGIGGGDYKDGGTITITDNAAVTAQSRAGAGIGGGYFGGSGGTITIDGSATVTATSTERGAGIGGGYANTSSGTGGSGGTITIGGDATVTATGSASGAGIGGGGYGSGGSVTIEGNPAVTAASIGAGAGIGGGNRGAGGEVVIDGGTVTAKNGPTGSSSSAVGPGDLGTAFGSLAVNAPGTLIIPADATLRVPDGVTLPGDGELRGAGTVVNNGAIQLPTANVDWADLGVLPHNYLITFDANGGTPTNAVRVFATSFRAGARVIPADPTREGFAFLGWNTQPDGGRREAAIEIGPDTPLSADLTVYAQWAAQTVTKAVPRGTPTAGADLPVDVQVTAKEPSAGIPQGEVRLYVDGKAVGSPVTLDAEGKAVLTYPDVTAGDHVLSVEFIPAGSAWIRSDSGELPITVPVPGAQPGDDYGDWILPVTGSEAMHAVVTTGIAFVALGTVLLVAARRTRPLLLAAPGRLPAFDIARRRMAGMLSSAMAWVAERRR